MIMPSTKKLYDANRYKARTSVVTKPITVFMACALNQVLGEKKSFITLEMPEIGRALPIVVQVPQDWTIEKINGEMLLYKGLKRMLLEWNVRSQKVNAWPAFYDIELARKNKFFFRLKADLTQSKHHPQEISDI